MRRVAEQGGNVCYTCDSCGMHWHYDGHNPAYIAHQDPAECPVCEGFTGPNVEFTGSVPGQGG
ncbi:MAG: hypothetical protein ACE5IA_07045 [Dehalococcoidia bacterium]